MHDVGNHNMERKPQKVWEISQYLESGHHITVGRKKLFSSEGRGKIYASVHLFLSDFCLC